VKTFKNVLPVTKEAYHENQRPRLGESLRVKSVYLLDKARETTSDAPPAVLPNIVWNRSAALISFPACPPSQPFQANSVADARKKRKTSPKLGLPTSQQFRQYSLTTDTPLKRIVVAGRLWSAWRKKNYVEREMLKHSDEEFRPNLAQKARKTVGRFSHRCATSVLRMGRMATGRTSHMRVQYQLYTLFF